MLIAITITSILVITALVWFVNRFLPFTVCPICAGSFLTWVGLLGAYRMGYAVDLTIPAVLMGGSVVGIAYQIEKKFWRPTDAPLLFKVFFMPGGFLAAYAVLAGEWIAVLVILVFLAVVAYAFIPKRILSAGAAATLEKKMEDCC